MMNMLRRIIITTAIVTASCIFSACANNAEVQPDVQIIEQEEQAESDKTNLKESIVQDYAIESYEDVQKFGYDLFTQNINDHNPVLSPVSAYLALSMAGSGADGATKDEFYNVLGNDLMSLSDDMMNRYCVAGDRMDLSIANSVWIDDQFIVNDLWIESVESLMDAEIFQTVLSTEQTMNQINGWIDAKTSGLIENMLTEPLDLQTRLALFNTVYFKGKWEVPFEPQNTHKEDFYLQKGQEHTAQVDMMNLYLTELAYISNDFVEGVILPYQKNGDGSGTHLAFVALKPTETDVIREVYSKMTKEVITDILDSSQTQIVNLKLPRFEVIYDKELNKSLINMGLTECFDEEKANFDQLGKTKNQDLLYINLVRQKAKITVDEEGTEAAAATEVLMMDRGGMVVSEIKDLYFNEPFIYMIIDLETELPLFIGVLDSPIS